MANKGGQQRVLFTKSKHRSYGKNSKKKSDKEKGSHVSRLCLSGQSKILVFFLNML